MNFKFLLISILITTGLVGGAFAQQVVQLTPQEFTQEEIDKIARWHDQIEVIQKYFKGSGKT